MWNHLVSQKTWQNDEEDKCNVRSAKRGERRGEREEKIEHNVQACNLKSAAQKVSHLSLPFCLSLSLSAPLSFPGSLTFSLPFSLHALSFPRSAP